MEKKSYPSDSQDRFVVRLPDGMRDHIAETAKANNRSMNAEIIARLEASFESSGELPAVVRDQIAEEAERLGISPQEALARLVVAGSQPGAPMVLYVRADVGMTIEQYRALFEAAKEFTPPDASVFLEQG